MKTRGLFVAGLLTAFLFGATASMGQKVPVVMQADLSTNDDPTALRFSKSLSDDIQLSGKFYYWTAKDSALPSNGIRILVRSIQIKLEDGSELGSAIFVEADRPSLKEAGYYKVISGHFLMIPKDASVADETRSFRAEVDRSLEP